MKKIWIFNHYATEMYFNKGGRHYWFAKELASKGYDVTIFCASTCHNRALAVEVKGKYSIQILDDIKFVFVPTKKYSGNGLDRITNMIQFYTNLNKSAKEIILINGKPDIILASSVHPLTMVRGILLGKKLKIPCVCEVRDLWPEAIFKFSKLTPNSLIGKCLMSGEHWIYRKADSIIFTKEGDIDYLRENNWTLDTFGDIDQNKIFYINNGVDLDNYDKLKNESFDDQDLNDNRSKIVYTGSLRPVNDVYKLIEVAELMKERKSLVFLIYGGGSEKENLINEIKKRKLTNIIIKGEVEKNRIPYILSKADINLLHYSENLYDWSRGNSSNKLFEYLASQKPIVSTVKMGYSIIENNQCGIESDSNSAIDIAKAIDFLLENPDLSIKFGENSYRTAKLFDFKILTEKLEDVLLNTIDRRR